MDKQAVLDWAAEKMGQAEDAALEIGYRLHHGHRVGNLALSLANLESIPVNCDVVYVAGVLHDLGKSGGQTGKGHAARGAEIIRAEAPHLFDQGELEQVCEIVANHNKRPNHPRYEGEERPHLGAETLLIQDADLLDHFGLIGIWAKLHWNAAGHRRSPERLNEAVVAHEDDIAGQRKLLNFEASRAEFDVRWGKEKDFYSELVREGGGALGRNIRQPSE